MLGRSGGKKTSKVELIDQTKDVANTIRKSLDTAQSRQKSYADNRRRPLVEPILV